MYGTTPIKVLERQRIARQIAYKHAQMLSWEHDKKEGIIKLMWLISVWGIVASPFYPFQTLA